MIEMLSLEEQANWPFSDDPEIVTEADIDFVAEILAADAEAEEVIEHYWAMRAEVSECCGGRSWNCAHYGVAA